MHLLRLTLHHQTVGAVADSFLRCSALPHVFALDPFSGFVYQPGFTSSPSAHSPNRHFNQSPGGSFIPGEASDSRWSLVSTFVDPIRDSDAASSLVVDAAHNILWAGHMSGQVTGYSIESSTRLVSFQAHETSAPTHSHP